MPAPTLPDLLAALAADATVEGGAPFLHLAADHFARTAAEAGPVSAGRPARELAARFDEPLPQGIRPLGAVVDRLARDVLPDVNRLSHPMYLGHQVSAPLPVAVWSDLVISAVNNSQAVREMSPVTTPIERRLIAWMAELAGFGAGAGGTLTSGGTEATLTALLAARAALRPGAWQDGLTGPPPVLVAGEHAHYAVSRAAGVMGIGAAHCLAVPSRDHRMDPGALETMLTGLRREGREILAVVATAGCTATGAFDDLEAIATVCERAGAWLHVDGAHGASALLSDAHRHRVRGIARAQSLAWDPHKMMLLPLAAGAVLVRDVEALGRAYAQRAPYLFHEADEADTGLGPVSFQCSRRADALKVWVALQRYGADGIGVLHDHLCALTSALHDRVAARSAFEVLHRPESNILCFRYRADDAFNASLRARYNRSGHGWITATALDGRRVLRVTVMNPRTTEAHLDRLLDGLEAEAHRMVAGRDVAGSSGRALES